MFLQNGPYLQDPKKDSILICWETNEISSSEVSVYETCYAHVNIGKSSLCGSPKTFTGNSGTFHQVKVDGLSAGTDYCYQISSRNDKGVYVGDTFSFRTAPDEASAFSFVLTSENGGTGGASGPYVASIMELIRRDRPDFIQSVGDILGDGRDSAQWNFWFFKPFQKLLVNTPFYPCVGNHEVGDNAVKDSNVESYYANYKKYFAFSPNYSFDYGCAHFCVLDCPSMFESILNSETDEYIPTLKDNIQDREAYRFLEQDLAQSNAKWKFVIFHYPPYTSAHFEVPELRIFAPLLEKYGVDIVFKRKNHRLVFLQLFGRFDAVYRELPDSI